MTEFPDSIMEDIENINIESSDILPGLRRVVDNYKLTDHIAVAAMMHAITVLFVDFFVANSIKGNMDENTIMEHWMNIAATMTQMILADHKSRMLN
jgi:hypothetical protein